MLRFSANKFNKIGLMVVLKKQSQKLFFSSTHDIPSTSLLKARHDMERAGLTEGHDVEIPKHKYDVEINKCDVEIQCSSLEIQNIDLKYFKEQINLHNSNLNVSAEVPKESLPTVSVPSSLFQNEDDIDDFCVYLGNAYPKKITPEIAQKIVYVLRNYPGDAFRTDDIIGGVYFYLNAREENRNISARNLSDAGFGHALSVVLSARNDALQFILDFVTHYFGWSTTEGNTCVQDLYDAIDSPTGYNGAIFDALLQILEFENDSCQIDAAIIAIALINRTKMAKQIMIEKGYLSVLAAMPNCDRQGIITLKRRLNEE